MRRALPFVIIGAVLIVALGAGLLLFRSRFEPERAMIEKALAAKPQYFA